jgi:aminoglycoside/choline kinase family phosphotransferase
MKVQAETAISSLYRSWSGEDPEQIRPIAASGSARRYFRIGKAGTTVIGAFNPDLKENEAFYALTRHFHKLGLPVPELLATDPGNGIYLLSDLGDISLFEMIGKRARRDHIPDQLFSLLAKTVRMLPHFQVRGGQGLDYSVCYPAGKFDEQSMMWDLNYFKYYILKTSGIIFNEQRIENDFRNFAGFLMQAGHDHFMYRDFQSRNVMVADGKPWFIDYQGGRMGPLQYDLASFLYQVKAFFPEEVREKLLVEYLDELTGLAETDRGLFMKYFYPFAYLRLFQVLGAYGFRGLFEKRPHFADSLVPAVESLASLLSDHPLEADLPELKSALLKLTQSSKYLPVDHKRSGLTVTIGSFSYKNGLPHDDSGHGGGFIFDCRALPNPGRLDEYKDLTGRDQAVIEYIERHQEADRFLHHVFAICDSTIEEYIERDFQHLSIGFGCTGGRHRSVYCADKLAEHLSKKYVIGIDIRHREQQITETKKKL